MPTATLPNRRGNVVACDRFAVAFFRHHDDYREYDTGGFEIGVDLNLSGDLVFLQGVDDAVDVRPQPFVVVPGDSTRDGEFALRSPEVAVHTQ